MSVRTSGNIHWKGVILVAILLLLNLGPVPSVQPGASPDDLSPRNSSEDVITPAAEPIQIWETALEGLLPCAISAADLTGDGKLEMVLRTDDGVHCIDSLGQIVWSYDMQSYIEEMTFPIADFNRDNLLEVLVTDVSRDEIVILDGQGNVVSSTHFTQVWANAPCVLDVNGDSWLEAIVATGQQFTCMDSRGWLRWATEIDVGPFESEITSNICAADLDHDGSAEIIATVDSGHLVCLDSATGDLVWYRAVTGVSSISAITVADIEGNDNLEILVSTLERYVYCIDSDGLISWYYRPPLALIAQPCVVDIDNSGDQEVLLSGSGGGVYCLSSSGALEWAFSTSADLGSPSVLDVDGNGYLECIVPGTRSYVLSHLGGAKWTIDFGARGSPCVADIDLDGRTELVICDEDTVRCYRISETPQNPGAYPWTPKTAQAEIRRRGVYSDGDSDLLTDNHERLSGSFPDSSDSDMDSVDDFSEFATSGCPRGGGILSTPLGILDWDSGGGDDADACIADIGGDGLQELVMRSDRGRITVTDRRFIEEWEYDLLMQDIGPICVFDAEGDGHLETVFGRETGWITCLDHSGVLSWHIFVGGRSIYMPCVVDLQGDGLMEIVCVTSLGGVVCIDGEGELLWSDSIGHEPTEPVAADIDLDGDIEILVGSEDGGIFCFSDSGELEWSRTNEDTSVRLSITEELGGDFRIMAGTSSGQIWYMDNTGTPLWTFEGDIPCCAPCAIDLNRDEAAELCFSSGSKIWCLDSSGIPIWNFTADSSVGPTVTILDVDCDDTMEVLFGTSGGFVYCLDDVGSLEWIFRTSGGVCSLTAGDTDGNGISDILAGTSTGSYHTFIVSGVRPEERTYAWPPMNSRGNGWRSGWFDDHDGDTLTTGFELCAGSNHTSMDGDTDSIDDKNEYLQLTNPMRDDVPPGEIDDLSLASVNGTVATISWTATGENQLLGRATSYVVVFALVPEVLANVFLNDIYNQSWIPLNPGDTEERAVDGLIPGSRYAFAIRAVDEQGNEGPLSNVLTFSTSGGGGGGLITPANVAAWSVSAVSLAVIAVFTRKSYRALRREQEPEDESDVPDLEDLL